MRFKKHLMEEFNHILTLRMRKRIEFDIDNLIYDVEFNDVPIKEILKILKKHGLIPVDDNGKEIKLSANFTKLGVIALKNNNIYPILQNTGITIDTKKINNKYTVMVYFK